MGLRGAVRASLEWVGSWVMANNAGHDFTPASQQNAPQGFAGHAAATSREHAGQGFAAHIYTAVQTSSSAARYKMTGFVGATPQSWTDQAPPASAPIVNPLTGNTVTNVTHVRVK